MIKEIAIQISVKHIRTDNDLFIHRFTFLGNKRNWRYLTDDRFYTSKVFKSEVLNRGSHFTHDDYIFCDRIEQENGIDIVYADNVAPENEDFNDYYFTIHDFVPTTFGCEYCRFNLEDIDAETVECNFFRKHTKKRKGSCKYFDQRRLFKT